MSLDYSDEEWAAAVAGEPLKTLPDMELALLHRQWMWANQQRERFDELLPSSDRDNFVALISKDAGHMLAWYSFLWSVMEAFEDRGIVFGGRFAEDIAAISDDLRRLRNAVFHVPKVATMHDKRLVAFIGRPDSVDLVRRVHRGFGRLFLTQMRQRTASGAA